MTSWNLDFSLHTVNVLHIYKKICNIQHNFPCYHHSTFVLREIKCKTTTTLVPHSTTGLPCFLDHGTLSKKYSGNTMVQSWHPMVIRWYFEIYMVLYSCTLVIFCECSAMDFLDILWDTVSIPWYMHLFHIFLNIKW